MNLALDAANARLMYLVKAENLNITSKFTICNVRVWYEISINMFSLNGNFVK